MAMMYVRNPLSLHNVEDLLAQRGIDICHETAWVWWNRFGPMFAMKIRKKRVAGDDEHGHIILDDRRVGGSRRSVGRNGQHDLALSAASGSTLMRLCSISKREAAVDHDAHGAIVEQSASLYKLRAAGAYLHR